MGLYSKHYSMLIFVCSRGVSDSDSASDAGGTLRGRPMTRRTEDGVTSESETESGQGGSAGDSGSSDSALQECVQVPHITSFTVFSPSQNRSISFR